MPLDMEVVLRAGDFVFDGTRLPPEKRAHAPHPIFGPCLLWPRSAISATAELLFKLIIKSFLTSYANVNTCTMGDVPLALGRGICGGILLHIAEKITRYAAARHYPVWFILLTKYECSCGVVAPVLLSSLLLIIIIIIIIARKAVVGINRRQTHTLLRRCNCLELPKNACRSI